MKRALITGINGQDGSYLAEFLLKKGYDVHGIVRRSSTFNRWRIDHLRSIKEGSVNLEYGDLGDSSSIVRVMEKVQPDEIYNLAAQSHVQVSFETPEYTGNIDALGVLRVLESIRILGLSNKVKLYQASTSELYGNTPIIPQNENTPFEPVSPYGVAKLYAFWVVKSYREAYDIFGANGILFNHESPRRGENFVSKKITDGMVRVKLGFLDCLKLGNLDAQRDWGYAKEYVEAMWLMLQQKSADDFVIASGKSHSVKDFVEEACKNLDISVEWEGEGKGEKGRDKKSGKVVVEIDERHFRPHDVNNLRGDISKAQRILKWQPKVTFPELVKIMVDFDLKKYQKFSDDNFIDYEE